MLRRPRWFRPGGWNLQSTGKISLRWGTNKWQAGTHRFLAQQQIVNDEEQIFPWSHNHLESQFVPLSSQWVNRAATQLMYRNHHCPLSLCLSRTHILRGRGRGLTILSLQLALALTGPWLGVDHHCEMFCSLTCLDSTLLSHHQSVENQWKQVRDSLTLLAPAPTAWATFYRRWKPSREEGKYVMLGGRETIRLTVTSQHHRGNFLINKNICRGQSFEQHNVVIK